MSNHSNREAVRASIYNLLQHVNKLTSIHLYDNSDDWDAAEEREIEKKREKQHKELTPRELNQIEDEKGEINTKKNNEMGS